MDEARSAKKQHFTVNTFYHKCSNVSRQSSKIGSVKLLVYMQRSSKLAKPKIRKDILITNEDQQQNAPSEIVCFRRGLKFAIFSSFLALGADGSLHKFALFSLLSIHPAVKIFICSLPPSQGSSDGILINSFRFLRRYAGISAKMGEHCSPKRNRRRCQTVPVTVRTTLPGVVLHTPVIASWV